jgi:hypothetical protein
MGDAAPGVMPIRSVFVEQLTKRGEESRVLGPEVIEGVVPHDGAILRSFD